MRFAVGQRVKVVRVLDPYLAGFCQHIGRVGTVTQSSGFGTERKEGLYAVEFAGSGLPPGHLFYESELEAAE